MPEPDFEQIARQLVNDIDTGMAALVSRTSVIQSALRQVWNAGKDAGAQHETFIKHLKDENTAAHLALDRACSSTTKTVPNRSYTGTQAITMGLAERIDLMRRQVWNARGAADEDAIRVANYVAEDGEVHEDLVVAIRSLDR